MTNDLQRRTYEHKEGLEEGFTKRYHVTQLVYFEEYSDVREAIAREKQLKNWSRAKKAVLIAKANPKWRDLFEEMYALKSK